MAPKLRAIRGRTSDAKFVCNRPQGTLASRQPLGSLLPMPLSGHLVSTLLLSLFGLAVVTFSMVVVATTVGAPARRWRAIPPTGGLPNEADAT
jgi:hypothetical protein